MLSATTNWRAAFESAQTPLCLLALISTSSGVQTEGVNQFTFSSCLGPASSAFFPAASLVNASGITAEINVNTRTLTLGQVSLEFLGDSALKDLVATPVYLKNKLVTLYLGTPSLAFNDMLQIGQYVIQDLRSNPGNKNLILLLKDMRTLAESVMLQPNSATGFGTSQFVCHHPLENALTFLQLAGVFGSGPNSGNFGSTMDPSLLNGSIGHLNCSRFSRTQAIAGNAAQSTATFDGGISSALNLRDALADMEKLLGGTLFVDESGRWQFHRWNAGASIVDTWGADDLDELQIVESWREQYNAIQANYASSLLSSRMDWVVNAGGQFHSQPTLYLYDSVSKGRYQGPGDQVAQYPMTLTSSWLNGLVTISSWGAGIGAGSAVASHLALMGVCGARYDGLAAVPGNPNGWTIPAWAQCSANQPTYFRVTGKSGGFFWQEVLTCTGIATTSLNADQDAFGLYRPSLFNLTIQNRGLFGTTAFDWSQPLIGGGTVVLEDITIPVLLYQQLSLRAKDGLTKIRVTTPLSKFPVQIGDLVALNDTRGALNGYSGMNPAVTWEVVRKELYLFDSNPRIQWLLALANNPIAAATLTSQNTTNWWWG